MQVIICLKTTGTVENVQQRYSHHRLSASNIRTYWATVKTARFSGFTALKAVLAAEVIEPVYRRIAKSYIIQQPILEPRKLASMVRRGMYNAVQALLITQLI